MVANSSAWPAASGTTAGFAVSPAGLAPTGLQPCHEPPRQRSTAAVPALVMQNTASLPWADNGTGELAQLPPMPCHGVQLLSALGAVWRVVRTAPPDPVTKTSTSPPGRRAAPGSRVMAPGELPAPSGPPHCQPSGALGCCQAYATWPAVVRANTVRSPFASAATAGLLAMLAGESPTVLIPDQPWLPVRCW